MKESFVRVCTSSLIIAVGVVLFTFDVSAVSGWVQSGPEGADVRSLAVDETNGDIVYLAAGGSVWKSTDAGGHWFEIDRNLGSFYMAQIAVDPADPDWVYAGTGHGFFSSSDAGNSWLTSKSSLEVSYVNTIAVDPRGQGVVYKGVYGKVFKSTDRGKTWLNTTGAIEPGSVYGIRVDPAAPDNVYVVTSNGIFKSTDAGGTWVPANTGLTSLSMTCLLVAGNVLYSGTWGNGLFRSTDGGASWASAYSGGGGDYIVSLAADASRKVIYAGSLRGAVFKSTDSGLHWDPLDSGTGRDIHVLAVHQQHPNIIYAGGETGFRVSTDGGSHWQPSQLGLRGQQILSLAVDDWNSNVFYAGTQAAGIWKTTDAGQTWASIGPAGWLDRIVAIVKVPNANVLYAATGGAGLQKTTDGGATWTKMNGGFSNSVTIAGVSPVDSRVVAAGGGVFVSPDGGSTWANRTGQLPAGSIYGLGFDPVDAETFYVGYYEQGMFKTTDGGQNWTEIGSFGQSRVRALTVDPWDRNVILAGTDSGFHRSTDGGATWSTVGLGLKQSMVRSFAFGPGKTIIVGTWQGGIYRSQDHGESWSEFQPGIPSAVPVWALALSRQSDGTLLAGTDGAGIFASQYTGQNTLFFPQVADGVLGTLRFRTTIILANGGEDTQATVSFKDSQGNPMALALGDSTPKAVHSLTLKRGQSVSLQTLGTAPLKAGYAVLTAGPQVSGTAVFAYHENGICMYQAGVPATQALYGASVLFDASEPGRNVGLAVVNASDTSTEVTFRLFDEALNVLASRQITDLAPTFGAGHYLARYATEIFPEITAQHIARGVISIESERPIAAVTLRQTDDPSRSFPEEVATMCAFPVIERRVEASPVWVDYRSIYFSQVANGQQGEATLRTSLVLLNTGRAATFTIEFFGSTGSRMVLPIRNLGLRSVITETLERGQVLRIETTGEGQVTAGYARVYGPLTLGGTAVFTYSENGVRLFEAGVPAASPTRRFCIYMDNSDAARATGLAIVNSSAAASNVTFRLYDNAAGAPIATREITSIVPVFGAGNHLARYASEIFPEIKQQNIKGGIITVESSEPLAAVTLRQQDDPSKAYPADVYLMSIFPVIALLP